MVQVATLSDIHGNRWALEAVLRDMEKRGIIEAINLGDCFFGPLDPRGTARILMKKSFVTVRGNEDRVLLAQPGPSMDRTTWEYTRKAAGVAGLVWTEALEPTAVALDSLYLCHGTPRTDDAYLLREVRSGETVPRGDEDVARDLEGVLQAVVLCGHDHSPAVRSLTDGRLVVNPGSVGLPAYVDALPRPHRVETGSPQARYAVLSGDGKAWQAELVAVDYDFEAAADRAREMGRLDWAEWLSTGRAPLAGFP